MLVGGGGGGGREGLVDLQTVAIILEPVWRDLNLRQLTTIPTILINIQDVKTEQVTQM